MVEFRGTTFIGIAVSVPALIR